MKKSIILTVVFILQLVLITSFACELNVTVNSVNKTSRSHFSKIEKSKLFSSLSTNDVTSDHASENFFHCNHCEGCSHFLLTIDDFFSIKRFNRLYNQHFYYSLIYNQPDLSFLSKPPIHI